MDNLYEKVTLQQALSILKTENCLRELHNYQMVTVHVVLITSITIMNLYSETDKLNTILITQHALSGWSQQVHSTRQVNYAKIKFDVKNTVKYISL